MTSKCADNTCTVSHIWTLDPVSGAERQVTSAASSWEDDPAVSPDGSRVAFQRCQPAGKCRIAVVDIGGGAVTDLTTGAGYDDYPTFSPDGRKLVFSRNEPAAGTHLITIDAAGGNEHALTSGTAFDRHATWSPDGQTIVFERSLNGSTSIQAVPAAGGLPTPLTAGPGDRGPDFSPDGAQIVFTGNEVVKVMDSHGGGVRALTAPGASHDQEPAFSPDGTQIVFERYDPVADASPLLVMNADGSGPHVIGGATDTRFRADWQPIAAPAAAPPATPPASPAPDTVAPGVTLAAPSSESIRTGRLYLVATSTESATAVARGKSWRSGATALSANTPTKMRLSISKRRLRAIRASLRRHEKVAARIAVDVRDGAGNVTTKALTIRLKK